MGFKLLHAPPSFIALHMVEQSLWLFWAICGIIQKAKKVLKMLSLEHDIDMLKKRHILVTISKIQCFPGKSGRLDNISARIQPTDQMSMALLYPLELSIISGALYHLVATYSVKIPLWSCSGSATRANPKSQIWRDKIIITIHFTIRKQGMNNRFQNCCCYCSDGKQ